MKSLVALVTALCNPLVRMDQKERKEKSALVPRKPSRFSGELFRHEVCRDEFRNAREFAVTLEDTAVVIPALIPWAIACSVPLATIGADPGALIFSWYLYLIPLWGMVRSVAARIAKH